MTLTPYQVSLMTEGAIETRRFHGALVAQILNHFGRVRETPITGDELIGFKKPSAAWRKASQMSEADAEALINRLRERSSKKKRGKR